MRDVNWGMLLGVLGSIAVWFVAWWFIGWWSLIVFGVAAVTLGVIALRS